MNNYLEAILIFVDLLTVCVIPIFFICIQEYLDGFFEFIMFVLFPVNIIFAAILNLK